MSHWDNRFFDMVELVASWSEDTSSKVGAVIVGDGHEVLSIGFNGLPRRVKYRISLDQRSKKYKYFEHAERNAIYNAARIGVSLIGSTIYLRSCPCADCARAIIQSGMRRIKIKQPNTAKRWHSSVTDGLIMLLSADVEIMLADNPLFNICSDLCDLYCCGHTDTFSEII